LLYSERIARGRYPYFVHSSSFTVCGPGPGVRRTPAGPFLFTPAFYYFSIT
jgi:hypothetical protein